MRNVTLRLALLLGAAFALLASTAQAQQAMVSLGDLQAAAEGPPQDAALTIFEGILGPFAVAPWGSAGIASGLIGQLFFIFNGIIFAVGAGFVGWLALAAIAASAHKGEPLAGSSGLWAPIRLGVGIFGMLPVFGGFSLFQAVTMGVISLGIGAGNLMTEKLVSATQDFQAIVPSFSAEASAPNLSSDVEALVRGLVLSELCSQGWGAVRDAVGVGGSAGEPRKFVTRRGTEGIDYGSCGTVEVRKRAGADVRESASMLAFRSSAVDYSAISNAVHAVAISELDRVQGEASRIAKAWLAARKDGGQGDPTLAAYAAVKALESETRHRLNSGIRGAVRGDEGAIREGALATIREGGWMKIGSVYAVFAEVGAALADAQRAFEYLHLPGPAQQSVASGGRAGAAHEQALREFLIVQQLDEQRQAAGSSAMDRVLRVVSSPVASLGGAAYDAVHPENELGERSTGQAIVNALTRGIAEDSGGAGLVNPVLAAKNLGDWLMVAGQTGVAGGTVASSLGAAGKTLKVAAKFVPAVQEVGQIMAVIFWVFVGVGLFLSVFVPMLFWATWISALLIYLTSMLEALIYSQLAAFGHLRMGGETYLDAGSPGAKIYVHFLNCLLRPSVMILGFVIGSAMLIAVGSLVLEGFSLAMASAQGNSTTGLLSVAGYLILFAVVLFGLVQSSANLCIDLPDRLLGWVGGQAENNKGPVVGAAAGAALRGVKSPGGAGASAVAAAAPKVKS